MPRPIAIIGAGVSGLTCGVLFAEGGFRTAIFAKEIGQQTTSAVAAAIWFPYDAEPADKVIPWAIEAYKILVDLCQDRCSGVSMIELRQLSRALELQIPNWASSLGASSVGEAVSFPYKSAGFSSGFAITVPLTDTTIYLDYLANRFRNAGGEIYSGIALDELESVDPDFNLVINCTGIGARQLAGDVDLEPHRGQVVLVPRIEQLSFAFACDEAPLRYAIPRATDCVLGGTNDLSDDLAIDPAATARILNDCTRALNLAQPKILAERVGLRPFRRSGVRLERNRLRDGRPVIHNYGHGGSGFTLSWGCAKSVFELAS